MRAVLLATSLRPA